MSRKRTCKGCKEKFEQIRTNQIVCSYKCATNYNKELNDKKEKQHWRAKKKRMQNEIKTRSEHLKELQTIFNKFIRLRDKDKPCISCGAKLKDKYDAGHYRSVGSTPELRFNEDNVHAQCVYCNQHLHGNLIEYRKGLKNRIGEEKVLLLENYHLPLKLSIPEIVELKVIYKDKIKSLI